MDALATARRRQPLFEGGRLQCPRCKTTQPLFEFFVFDRPQEFEDELNVVYKCRAKVRHPQTGKVEACRCVFSLSGQDAVLSEGVDV